MSQNYIPINEVKVSVNEHRIFQQFTSKQEIGSVKLNHRYRFEQRFIESDFKMCFRYFLGLNIPLNKASAKNSFYFSFYNELFINLESKVFDRNRLYGGLVFKTNKNIKIEAGYMHQFFEQSGRDQINILAFVNVS